MYVWYRYILVWTFSLKIHLSNFLNWFEVFFFTSVNYIILILLFFVIKKGILENYVFLVSLILKCSVPRVFIRFVKN